MGFLTGAWQRAISSENAIISGAKLHVYVAGTTTEATVYTNSALTVPASLPLTSNTEGWFDPLYAPLGVSYDIRQETAAAVLIGKLWRAQEALGTDSGTFSREFDGGRWQVYAGDMGDADEGINLEFGDPSPDNVGGKGRIGGFNLTSLDRLILDADDIDIMGPISSIGDINTTGVLMETGKRFASAILTGATTVTNQATANILLPNTPTAVRAYKVTVFDIQWHAGGNTDNLRIRLAYDATPTFKTGASDYSWNYIANQVGTGAVVNSDDADTFILASSGVNTTAARPASVSFTIITPDSAAGVDTLLFGMVTSLVITTGTSGATFTAHGRQGYGRATAVQVYGNNGNITCKYMVEALRGYM